MSAKFEGHKVLSEKNVYKADDEGVFEKIYGLRTFFDANQNNKQVVTFILLI